MTSHSEPRKYSNKEKADEIRRELGYRRHVYRRFVNAKRMSQQEATTRIEIMEAILADYQALDASDRPQLF